MCYFSVSFYNVSQLSPGPGNHRGSYSICAGFSHHPDGGSHVSSRIGPATSVDRYRSPDSTPPRHRSTYAFRIYRCLGVSLHYSQAVIARPELESPVRTPQPVRRANGFHSIQCIVAGGLAERVVEVATNHRHGCYNAGAGFRQTLAMADCWANCIWRSECDHRFL